MNELIRGLLTENIKHALADAKKAKELDHSPLNGKFKEILLDKLISPLLNKKYSTGTGKIIDYNGKKSKEIDICIYSTSLHPPIFFDKKSNSGLFPMESVLSCIEVKSSLTKKNIQEAYERFKYLEENLTPTSGIHNSFGDPVEHLLICNKYSVFIFDTKLKNYKPDTILEMYKQVDPNWNSNPLISSICLCEKGWLCYTLKGWLHMPYNKIENINEEIIGYLCTMIQDLPRVEASRGLPRIGYYLSDPTKMGRFKNGKLIKKPWNDVSFGFKKTIIG